VNRERLLEANIILDYICKRIREKYSSNEKLQSSGWNNIQHMRGSIGNWRVKLIFFYRLFANVTIPTHLHEVWITPKLALFHAVIFIPVSSVYFPFSALFYTVSVRLFSVPVPIEAIQTLFVVCIWNLNEISTVPHKVEPCYRNRTWAFVMAGGVGLQIYRIAPNISATLLRRADER
jgi:hypothetical protein